MKSIDYKLNLEQYKAAILNLGLSNNDSDRLEFSFEGFSYEYQIFSG